MTRSRTVIISFTHHSSLKEGRANVLERQALEEGHAGHPTLVHEPSALANRYLVDPAEVEGREDDAEACRRPPAGARREGEAGRGTKEEQQGRRDEQELGKEVEEVVGPARELERDANREEKGGPTKSKS